MDYKTVEEAFENTLKRSNDEGKLYRLLSINEDIHLAQEDQYLVSLRYALMKPMKNPFAGHWSTEFEYIKGKYFADKGK